MFKSSTFKSSTPRSSTPDLRLCAPPPSHFSPPERAPRGNDRTWRNLVKADLGRHYGRFSWPLLLRSALFKDTFAPVFSLRCYQAMAARGGLSFFLARPFLKLWHRRACRRRRIELPLGVEIGPGFRIVHGVGLVVNAGARIGANVTVFQGVTIGQRDIIRADGRTKLQAEIGDGALLGPYAQILGVRIGKGSTIAALSVAHKDVAPACVAGGNPLRVLRENALPDISHRLDEETA